MRISLLHYNPNTTAMISRLVKRKTYPLKNLLKQKMRKRKRRQKNLFSKKKKLSFLRAKLLKSKKR